MTIQTKINCDHCSKIINDLTYANIYPWILKDSNNKEFHFCTRTCMSKWITQIIRQKS